jgi:hypothetical protein
MQLDDQLRARMACLDSGTRPEPHLPNAVAQTRIVSVARIRLDSWKSVRPFKVIFCDDISEFESYMPSHAVGSLWPVYPVHGLCGYRRSPGNQHPSWLVSLADSQSALTVPIYPIPCRRLIAAHYQLKKMVPWRASYLHPWCWRYSFIPCMPKAAFTQIDLATRPAPKTAAA